MITDWEWRFGATFAPKLPLYVFAAGTAGHINNEHCVHHSNGELDSSNTMVASFRTRPRRLTPADRAMALDLCNAYLLSKEFV